MPKEITHIFFSDKTADALEKNNLSSILSDFSDYLHFGCIAVDSFYYSIKLSIFQKDYFQWGDLVHGAEGNDTSLLIIEMLDYLKNNRTDPLFKQKLSFTCGFITHFALDINFHPFVYYFSGNYYDPDNSEKINVEMRHRLIEGWLDLYFLKKYSLKLNSFDSIKRINNNKNSNIEILKFLSSSANKAWNNDNDIFSFLKKGYKIQLLANTKLFSNPSAFRIAKFVNNLFDNKLRGYVSLFYPSENQEIPDYIINFESFIHPVSGEKIKINLTELWNKSLIMSKDFLESVNEYIFFDASKEKLKSVIKGYSLDVGLIGVKVHEVKHFSPWDLSI